MSDRVDNLKKHAVVIGGSMAGLFAARVLSDHYERVTVLERDPVCDSPEARKGQPQARQGHGLLAHGFQIIKRLFPGIEKALMEGGAVVDDMGATIRWFQFGGYKKQHQSQLIGIVTDRPIMEWHIRRRVMSLANVTYRAAASVNKLVLSADRQTISGVEVTFREEGQRTETVTADLVIDASGRGSPTPKWLTSLGFEAPPEEIVRVDLGYASRTYRRQSDHLVGAKLAFVFPTPPDERRMGFILPIEGERWMVTLGGWAGDHPPRDEAGFKAFARSLPAPDISDIIDTAEPLSDVITYKFPGSMRRRYEKLNAFPRGYLVFGDAAASFTPVYAQGMTSAAMQALALDQELQKFHTPDSLRRSYFQHIAAVVDIPWKLAVGEDFRFPQTVGNKPIGTDIINTYVSKVHKATHHDPVVYRQFLRVMNLLAPATSLLQPRMLWRVLIRSGTSTRH